MALVDDAYCNTVLVLGLGLGCVRRWDCGYQVQVQQQRRRSNGDEQDDGDQQHHAGWPPATLIEASEKIYCMYMYI